MIVYRLCKEKYIRDLSGKGAEMEGGRWNSKGAALLYTSQSRALCTTEIAVHTPLGKMPTNYWIITIEFPDNAKIFEFDISKLPADWRSYPHTHAIQTLGDAFIISGKYLVMKVPSVVVPGDFNYLLNPAHTLFQQVKIIAQEPFEFDKRMIFQ
jgi:RES domain-containing protein